MLDNEQKIRLAVDDLVKMIQDDFPHGAEIRTVGIAVDVDYKCGDCEEVHNAVGYWCSEPRTWIQRALFEHAYAAINQKTQAQTS